MFVESFFLSLDCFLQTINIDGMFVCYYMACSRYDSTPNKTKNEVQIKLTFIIHYEISC